MYEIRTKSLNGIVFTGYDAPRWYLERHYKNREKTGYVLVKMKRVVSGLSFKIKIYWKGHFYKKPHWQWSRWGRWFHWLFFMLWLEVEYTDQVDHVLNEDELLKLLSNIPHP